MSEREAYTLEQFRQEHGLAAQDAERLFAKFGPRKFELDMIMAKKREFAESALRSSRRKPPARPVLTTSVPGAEIPSN